VAGRSRIVTAVFRLVLRLDRTPLRPLLTVLYRLLARTVGAYLTWGQGGTAIYTRGGLAADEFVPGLSDIDVAIVAPDRETADRVRRRWHRLRRLAPVVQLVCDWPRVLSDSELADVVGRSTFTYGLDGETTQGRAAYAYEENGAALDRIRALERPGLHGSTADWAPLTGADRRPQEAQRDAQAQRAAAWLELVFIWRSAFPFLADPSLPRAASTCVKLVADPARIWLLLARGERATSRVEALDLAARHLPEEEEALRAALELQRTLAELPEPPFADLLPAAVRISRRVATLIDDGAAASGLTEVHLAGDPGELILADVELARLRSPLDPGEASPLPLADWRGIVVPEAPEECFVLDPGDPGEAATLGAVAAEADRGPYRALRADDILILPGVELRRTRLRAIKGRAVDPIPCALAEGDSVARFPDVPGWSARDTARRAVAEHRSSVLHLDSVAKPARLGRLLSAARAGLFDESVRGDEPLLCVTTTETARCLGARFPSDSAVAEEAIEAHRVHLLRGTPPPQTTVSALAGLTARLPAYS
jgi:hypothetical protein